jgi:hypothetical protein
MLKVVIGFDLLTRVDRKSPIAPKSRFRNSVYSDRIKNALMLKGHFLTSSMHIKPAREVIRFNKNT